MPKYRRPADQIRDLKVVDQEILNLQIDARGSELYDYNVTWDAETTSPSIGNGTLSGKYRRVGTLVLLNIRLVIGTTTNQGTGAWNFDTPFAVDASSYWAGAAAGFNDSSQNWWAGASMIEGSGASAGKVIAIIGTNVLRARSGTPFIWDDNSSLFMSLWYGTTE